MMTFYRFCQAFRYPNQYGDAVSVVRGFRNPNNYIAEMDKVRVMIDGVAVNSETYGAASFVMDMPLDIVDRIEVLRGPALRSCRV